MATLKDVKAKMNGVQKTQQITRAMHMVAASKLRGAQVRMEGFRPYADKYAQIVGDVARSGDMDGLESLLAPPKNAKMTVHILLCTSDRGLAGGFTSNLVRLATDIAKEKKEEGFSVSFTCVGKKGNEWCRKAKYDVTDTYENILDRRFDFKEVRAIGEKIVRKFSSGEYTQVYIVYSQFVRASLQIAMNVPLLPILPPHMDEAKENAIQFRHTYVTEPPAPKLLAKLLLDGIYSQIYRAFLENSTSEHAARMTAMNNATIAANDILDELKIVYNKARQSAITSELIDIVGGAEALAG